jgi:hypothetical protein
MSRADEFKPGDRVQDSWGLAGCVVCVFPPGHHVQVIRVRYDRGGVVDIASRSLVPEGAIPVRGWEQDY